MRVHSEQLTIRTTQPIQLLDVTETLRAAVARSKVTTGIAVVATHHTTTAIRVNESCERLTRDLLALFERLAPASLPYAHNRGTIDGRGNAQSHLLAWLMGASENLVVREGTLELGRWQACFFVELDGPRPERHYTVTLMGE
ncbi:MAG: YjbQ family protein [Deltaproteobacteria bacterium]|nr:YjbQ family protein [Deltaproteobacteria bacterium]